MTRFATRWGLGLLVAAAAAGSAHADEQKVELKDVPPAVQAAVKARFPKGTMSEASKEEEKGKTVYEVEVKDGDAEYDVAASADGKILEVEKEVEIAALPKAITAAVEAKYPGATIKEAEALLIPDKAGSTDTESYELAVTLSTKKTRELKVSPEGKILEDEADDEDDDDDKDDKKPAKPAAR